MCDSGASYRVYTEWQWPFSGLHSIMMVNSAQPGGGGGGYTSGPFHSIYHHVQSYDIHGGSISTQIGSELKLFARLSIFFIWAVSIFCFTDRQNIKNCNLCFLPQYLFICLIFRDTVLFKVTRKCLITY